MTAKELWDLLALEERNRALTGFVDLLRSEKQLALNRKNLVAELARRYRFRPQTIEAKKSEDIASLVRPHAMEILHRTEWAAVFSLFLASEARGAMERFRELFPEPEGKERFEKYAEPLNLADGVLGLRREFGNRITLLLCGYVSHFLPKHSYLEPIVDELRQLPLDEAAVAEEADEAVQHTAGEPLEAAAEEFITLDRVLIEQVVATASGEEGALTHAKLEDLILSVVGLNHTRKRTYFHLGFMDALVPGREWAFANPDLNDERRAWYIAGLIAGYTRRRDAESAKRLLAERYDDFQRAAEEAGGAGESMAKLSFGFMLDCDRPDAAAALLQGQLLRVGQGLAESAEQAVAAALRRRDLATAGSLLQKLRAPLRELQDQDDDLTDLVAAVERRWGQYLQATGDFPGARQVFESLVEAGEGAGKPEILSDLGLTVGSFRALSEVRLTEDAADRERLKAALRSGEPWFIQAIQAAGSAAINANFALAVMCYLDSGVGSADGGDPVLVSQALRFIQSAITGINGSDRYAVYEKTGTLSHALFLQAVLQLATLDLQQAQPALAAWRRVEASAASFPLRDLQALLAYAEAHGGNLLSAVAESLWASRGLDVLPLLTSSALVRQSAFLKSEFLKLAKDEAQPRRVRWQLWSLVVPVLNAAGDKKAAEQGLDEMEQVAQERELRARFAEWLDRAEHYEPAWSFDDACWARARLFREEGRDAEALAALHQIFYRLRDRDAFGARQVIDTCRDWGMPRREVDALLAALGSDEEAADSAIETRLRTGERVSVVFVGGNEIQAQYDEQIRRDLCADYPGLQVAFEHTGWSSNWGREQDRLIRVTNEADAIVLMSMMRTLLGCTLRENARKPWVPCNARGKAGLTASIRKAAQLGLAKRQGV